ncbi:MAG TPA: hypothetical protein ENL16_00650, partial [Candidatus Woesearchaeota archaeon]|nr:hypothetical protein [Candidatus Woesearchaeota archaeon]
NMHNPALDTIKKEFNIQEAPTIVINEEVYAGYQSREALEEAIKKHKEEKEEKHTAGE